MFRRNHKRGASQTFVVLTESNLGELQKIKIGYKKLFALWHCNRAGQLRSKYYLYSFYIPVFSLVKSLQIVMRISAQTK